MKSCSRCVGLAILLGCSLFLSGSVFAQGLPRQGFPRQGFSNQGSRGFSQTKSLGFGTVNGNPVQDDDDRYGPNPQSLATPQQRSVTSVAGSRSVSFMKDGKRVSIAENASGVSVSVDGQRVQAKSPGELKRKSPDAYRLYDEHIGAAQMGGSARAFGNASGGSAVIGPGGRMQFDKQSASNRQISVMENGKQVSIVEGESGVAVFVNGKRVRSKNVAELKRRFPEAFKVYEKQLEEMEGAGRIEEIAGMKRGDFPSDATVLLREQLNQLRDENANDPQLRNLFENMIQAVDQ